MSYRLIRAVAVMLTGCAPAAPSVAPPQAVVIEMTPPPTSPNDDDDREPAASKPDTWDPMLCTQIMDDSSSFNREIAFNFGRAKAYGDRGSMDPFELDIISDDGEVAECEWRNTAPTATPNRVLTYLLHRTDLAMTKILWNDTGTRGRHDGEHVETSRFQCERLPPETAGVMRLLREHGIIDAP